MTLEDWVVSVKEILDNSLKNKSVGDAELHEQLNGAMRVLMKNFRDFKDTSVPFIKADNRAIFMAKCISSFCDYWAEYVMHRFYTSMIADRTVTYSQALTAAFRRCFKVKWLDDSNIKPGFSIPGDIEEIPLAYFNHVFELNEDHIDFSYIKRLLCEIYKYDPAVVKKYDDANTNVQDDYIQDIHRKNTTFWL